MIETDRLILRPYREADRGPFAEINAHPEVGAWLAGALTRAESDSLLDRINAHIAERGFGFFAAERKADGRLIGAIGLMIVGEELPGAGGLELAWRVHPEAQGAGLATEGARAVRDWAFERLGAAELIAFTAQTNRRSRAIMRKLGMIHEPARDFDHPRLPAGHGLRRHVFYSLKRPA